MKNNKGKIKITDITGWIHNDMWQYGPTYPGAKISECKKPDFIPKEVDVYCQKFEIGGQSGTYIETEAHVNKKATPIVDILLEELFMDVVVVKLSKKNALEKITIRELKEINPDIRIGDAVLLSSGWDKKWRDADFVDGSPYISCEAANWLLDKKIKLLGSDFPRFDNIKTREFPWQRFWKDAKFILSPVVNLDSVKEKRAKLCAFPLKIEGAMGTPCRAAIFEGVQRWTE